MVCILGGILRRVWQFDEEPQRLVRNNSEVTHQSKKRSSEGFSSSSFLGHLVGHVSGSSSLESLHLLYNFHLLYNSSSSPLLLFNHTPHKIAKQPRFLSSFYGINSHASWPYSSALQDATKAIHCKHNESNASRSKQGREVQRQTREFVPDRAGTDDNTLYDIAPI